jgi:hypothetical protein
MVEPAQNRKDEMTSTERNPYPCRKCEAANSASTRLLQTPEKNPEPLTPDYFDPEPTVEERVAALEKQVAQLTRTIQAVQSRQPIGDSDVPLF